MHKRTLLLNFSALVVRPASALYDSKLAPMLGAAIGSWTGSLTYGVERPVMVSKRDGARKSGALSTRFVLRKVCETNLRDHLGDHVRGSKSRRF